MSRQPYYLTTPIYYVNSVPHLGTAYTTVAADALARYRRMAGDDVVFLTGLDEHGQKVAQAAEENGMSPQEWCDSIAPRFLEAWEMLGISNDDFIRTTQERHKRGVQAFWTRLHDEGYLYKGGYEGWYCVPDETFYAEDQLEEGKCPGCGRDVQFIREENWFFKLSEFSERLLAYYEEHPGFIRPATRRNEVISFVESGLRDLSISRTTFSWGVPLPFAENHVTYVWIDALLNYVTAVGYGSEDPEAAARFERYWPAQVHFVGKDIIRFHCVIWPAMLMAAGLPLPESVFAHGFLLTKGEKMSKSKGNAVSPADLVAKFGVDAYRYYFLRDVQFGADGSISMEAMIQRINGDLANDWGNLCSRLFNMVGKYCDGRVPEASGGEPSPDDDVLRGVAEGLPGRYEAAMSELDYVSALESAWDLIKATNRYIEESAPWNLAKSEETMARLFDVLYNALEAVRIAALFCAPVMPTTSNEVWRRMGLPDITAVTDIAAESAWGRLPAGNPVEKGDPLFPRIDKEAE
ncbi:MAG: methionine--tRNA ligase [Coriobacteriia bacterium]|nr:methionine--tRNA ligase [Coriobacteriia bacterium]